MSVAKLVSAATVGALKKQQIVHFVEGLLDGLVQHNHLKEVSPCLKDSEFIGEHLDTAITDFKKKDIADIITGVSEVGKIIATVDTDLKDCTGMGDDIKRI